jgi:hypothetical protein
MADRLDKWPPKPYFRPKHRLNPPINTPYSSQQIGWRKCEFSFQSSSKFSSSRVERQRWGSEGRRTSRLVGTPWSSLGVEALLESIWDRWSFLSSSSIECRSSVGILQILTEDRLSSPSGVLDSRLVGIILWHYHRMGDLPIIVSRSFASLMFFVHLHTI